MEISEVLAYLEKDLLEKIDSLPPKDFCSFWHGIKEFEVAKMQRTAAAPLSETGNNFTVEHTTKVDEPEN